MKIAYLFEVFPCLSERFLWREVCELERQGVRVRLIALRRGELELADEEQKIACREVYFPPPGFSAATWRAKLAALVRQTAGVLSLSSLLLKGVARTLQFGQIRPVGRAFSLAELARAEGVDLIHATFASLPATVGLVASRASGLPFTFAAHARDVLVSPFLLREKALSARRVFCCNEWAHQAVRRALGVAGEAGPAGGSGSPEAQAAARLRLIRHGVELNQLKWRKPRLPGAAPARLVAAGRLVPKKGFHLLVQAAARLAREGNSLVLCLLGEGPERKRLEALARLAGGALRFQLPGARPHRQLLAEMTTGHLFVVPSHPDDQDRDGIPNVALEAIALGVPLVTSRYGSALGGMLTEKLAFLYDEPPVEGLCAALRRALHDPDGGAQRAEAARKWLEESFDLSRNVAELKKECESVLARE